MITEMLRPLYLILIAHVWEETAEIKWACLEMLDNIKL